MSPAPRSKASSGEAREAADELLRLGAAMLVAGNTATRTREWIALAARKLRFDAVSVSLSFDSITATVRRSGEWVTAIREVGPPAINSSRIAALEQLAKTIKTDEAPRALAAKLSEIESTTPLYSRLQIVLGVALASAGFAFINGAAAPEMIAAAIGGGFGQWLRAWLSRR